MKCCHQGSFSFVTKVFYQPHRDLTCRTQNQPEFKSQDTQSTLHLCNDRMPIPYQQRRPSCKAKSYLNTYSTVPHSYSKGLKITFTVVWYQNKHLFDNAEESETKVNERTCYISSVQKSPVSFTLLQPWIELQATFHAIISTLKSFGNWKILTSLQYQQLYLTI